MKSSLLLDFSSIRRGGGVQLALNFLNGVERTRVSEFDLCYLLPGDGELHARKEEFGRAYTCIASVPLPQRLVFVRREAQKFMQHNHVRAIFTFFGPGIPHPKEVVSIVNVAFPTICYSDSPFWKHLFVKESLKLRFINSGRRWQIRGATCLLAETELMKSRLARSVPFLIDKIHVIPPSPSLFIQDQERRVYGKCKRFLLLSGLAPHKNLWRLYEVARLAKVAGIECRFVMTVQRDAWLSSLHDRTDIDDAIVDRYFEFVGPVPSAKIGQLYESCDVLMNLSDLESFSSNYMESWKMGLPLICSDRDFSRQICGESALYVEPHQPDTVLRGMQRLVESPELRQSLSAEGKQRLANLPSLTERYDRIAEVIQCEIAKNKRGQSGACR
jgi:glycosyltransferase involved in cell wall biosynthesis